MIRRFLPLILFGVLALLLLVGLGLKPSMVNSPLINKAAPGFTLPTLHEPNTTFSVEQMKGQVWLLNVWASWCVSCRQEHPVLMDLSKRNEVALYGLNYKDERNDGTRWLQQFGNPYVASAFDLDGRVGINFGVYGVPETFVIDKAGIIRHKVIGPVSHQSLKSCVIPLVRVLKQAEGANVVVPLAIAKQCEESNA
jgi:cytochrome c biogenesis protein CcmG/thiol:disulfide interchange protein DsbE